MTCLNPLNWIRAKGSQGRPPKKPKDPSEDKKEDKKDESAAKDPGGPSDVDNFMSENDKRLNQKLGKKIGERVTWIRRV